MNVLVTGSNGFIGTHVCRYLKEKGMYVIGMGRRAEATSKVDEYVCCDMSSDDIFEIPNKVSVKIDAVIHLAADMRKEPYGVEIVVHNCSGMQRLLEMCEANGIERLAELSSLPVIGKPIQHPITEEHPLCPPTVYHTTKVAQEMLADYAHRPHGLKTISFRISAPVGEGMNEKTIFPTFVRACLENKPIVLSGKGSRKQTYVHAKDIAQALYLAICSDATGVYNLGSYNLISNYDLACKCKEILKSDSEITFSGTEDKMDDYVWDVSIDKICKDLGYKPVISIEDAILDYAEVINGGEK